VEEGKERNGKAMKKLFLLLAVAGMLGCSGSTQYKDAYESVSKANENNEKAIRTQNEVIAKQQRTIDNLKRR
jgi:PBP1b-binding outer membrane lipoprotein LpoB